ncbi:MAG: family 78 glycoside hydrolase catalytic domain [Chitinophagaceae bacterium]
MKRLLFFLFFLSASACSIAQELHVDNPRCNYRTNPLGVDLTPSLSWELRSGGKNISQKAYRLIVADDSALLKNDKGNVWDSKKISSSNTLQVIYQGKQLVPGKLYYWKVMVWDNKGKAAWSVISHWQIGLLKQDDWANAKWIGYEELPDTSIFLPLAHGRGKKEWGSRKNILPLLRKEFNVSKTVKRATAFISGLGHFELTINGKKTGDHFLDPGWTQYSKHALYVTFDITKDLQKGANALGVMLGNGFYYIPGERYRKLTGAYGYPKMIARVMIEYTDGSTDNIISDKTWKTSPSPITFSSIYGGEDYDATKEQPGWDKAGFNDQAWKNVVVTSGPSLLQSQMAEPVKVMQEFSPVKSTQLSNGQWIFDLGQNFSGITAIELSGKKGDTVRVIPAELLNDDGSANQKGTGGPFTFTYVLKGNGVEKWQPRFTYYGFRYLQVQGAAPETATGSIAKINLINGLHIRNAAATAGDFNTSDTLFGKIYKLIDWAIRSNTVSLFTDCPHREKLGWLEQTHLMGSSVQYNYDVAALNRKVIRDMIQSQTDDGLIPEIAPEYVHFEDPFRDSPEWGSASIILPWYTYKWYGDKQALEEAYPMMKRYITYLEKKSDNYILMQGLGDWYDIGPNKPGFAQMTPQGVTATATFYHDLSLMKEIATLLGKKDDANMYADLSLKVKKAFNDKFFNVSTKQYATGSQAANAMALHMGLVEPGDREAVVANLVKDIRNRNNALTAGDIGYRYVLRALEDAGRSDVIFEMNNRSDVPGYGYQLAHGATALTESWQALPAVSNNHFMLGHLMEWLYAGLVGIKMADDAVAFDKIELHPQPVGKMKSAEASYHSVRGLIKAGWKRDGNTFELKASIPANTTAKIFFPANTTYTTPLSVGSGEHTFTVKLK